MVFRPIAEFDSGYVLLDMALPGAAEYALLEAAMQAHRRGGRVVVLLDDALRDSPFARHAQDNGLELRWVDRARRASFAASLRNFAHLFAQIRIATLHIHSANSQLSWPARLAAHLSTQTSAGKQQAALAAINPGATQRDLALYDQFAPVADAAIPSAPVSAPSHIVGARVFARNLFANWLAVAADVVVAFFLTPLIISSLTLAVYGIWSLINSIVGYMGLVDLGIRGSVGRYVNHYLARRDAARVNQVIATSLFFLSAVSLLAIAASYLIAINFEVFFSRTPVELLDTLLVVLPLMAVNLWLLFVAAVFRNVLESFDRFDISNAIALAVLGLRTVGVVLVLRAGYGFTGLALVTVASSAASVVAHFFAAKMLFRPLSLAPRFISRERFVEMWRFGMASFIARSASHVIYQTDQIVVMIFFGPAMVGIYSVAALLVQNGQRLVDQVSSTLYPSIMKAGSLQDRSGLARVYLFQARIGLYMAVLLYVGYVVFGPAFIALWMGPGFEEAKWVLIILSLAEIAAVMSSNGGSVLFSLDKIRPNLIIAGSQALANLVLSILLAAYSGLGMPAVALATLISMTVMQAVVHPWYTTRQIGLTYTGYLLVVGWRALFTAMASFLLFHIVAAWGFGSNSWLGFMTNVLVAAAVYFSVATFILFRRTEVGAVLGHVPLIGGLLAGRRSAK